MNLVKQLFSRPEERAYVQRHARFVERLALGGEKHVRQMLGARRNPIMPNWADIQPWHYYDRLTAAAAATVATDLLWFTTPLSATKTKLDTNLKQAGRLPDPKHFLVTAMRFVFEPSMLLADITLVNRSYYVEFEIGDKIYAEGHFDLYPGGAGISGYTTRTAESTWFNGHPDPMAVDQWGADRGIHILQGQTFQVRGRAPTAITLAAVGAGGSGMNLRCVLDGILYREVQ
jgi:hypothetical protein